MALTPGGAQQWMCDAVVGEPKPPNETFTVRKSPSRVTKARPLPGEPVGGTSLPPVSVAVNRMMSALATLDSPVRASARTQGANSLFILASGAWTDARDEVEHTASSPASKARAGSLLRAHPCAAE